MWPAFHEGELAVQRRMGADGASRRMADYVTRSTLRSPSHQFLERQPLVAAAYVDHDDRLRLTLLWGPTGFVRVIDDHIARISPTGGVPTGLRQALAGGGPLGITALDVSRRRRAKAKGTAWTDGEHIHLTVTRTYASCPKYIQKRNVPEVAATTPARTTEVAALTQEVGTTIASADTAFIGTTHATTGPDAAHRGGSPGFLTLQRDTIKWREYPGNNMYNSLGNLQLDHRLALLAIDFNNGTTIELSGTATTRDEPEPAVTLTPHLITQTAHAVPAGWHLVERSPHNPRERDG